MDDQAGAAAPQPLAPLTPLSSAVLAQAAAPAAAPANPVVSFLDRDVIEPVKRFAGELESAIAGTPGGADALAKLKAEIAAVEDKGADVRAAVIDLAEPIAETALNYALGLIPGGAAFEGLADQVLEQLAAKAADKRAA